MPASVTKNNLVNIITQLCKSFGWVQEDEDPIENEGTCTYEWDILRYMFQADFWRFHICTSFVAKQIGLSRTSYHNIQF